MPNWCDNSIFLEHPDKSKVDALVKAWEDGNKTVIDDNGDTISGDFGFFHYLYPCPQEEMDSVDGGYNWRVENWGTKWDVNPDDMGQNGNIISTYFDSAWSPPIEFYNKLQKDGWKVNAIYYEPGMEYCGEYSDGVQSTFEYDGMTREEARATIPEDVYEFADLDYYFDCKEEEQEDEE